MGGCQQQQVQRVCTAAAYTAVGGRQTNSPDWRGRGGARTTDRSTCTVRSRTSRYGVSKFDGQICQVVAWKRSTGRALSNNEPRGKPTPGLEGPESAGKLISQPRRRRRQGGVATSSRAITANRSILWSNRASLASPEPRGQRSGGVLVTSPLIIFANRPLLNLIPAARVTAASNAIANLHLLI